MPKMFRPYFRYNRDLQKKLFLAARESLRISFREQLNLPDSEVGLVMVIHTFGDYLNFHPHIHVLAADGLFSENAMFYVMPEKGLKALEQLFRDQVFKFLIDEGRTEAVPKNVETTKAKLQFAEKLRGWKHSDGNRS